MPAAPATPASAPAAPSEPPARDADAPPLARILVLDEEAEAVMRPLLDRVVPSIVGLYDGVQEADAERQVRRVQRATTQVLATEGWFSPTVSVRPAGAGPALYDVVVEPGARTTVREVTLTFNGPIEGDAQELADLRAAWELRVGQPFRDADWSRAKTRLLGRVQARWWAAARLAHAEAEVDADAAAAHLHVTIESGPAFTLGDLEIRGLERYTPQLVQRFNTMAPGDPYDAQKLLELQRRLQNSPYFSSVVVDVEPDPARPERAPVRVTLVEAASRRVTFGTGFSTNTGPRIESTYRQVGVFGAPLTLQTGFGLDRTRSVAYADLLLPPKTIGDDSVGTLVERTHVNGLATRRFAVGAARAISRDAGNVHFETRYTLNLQRELRRFDDPTVGAPTDNDTLVAGVAWSRRDIDQITDPTRGDIVTLGAAAGVRRSPLGDLLDATFLRTNARYVRYVPIDPKTQAILRSEMGYVLTNAIDVVPQDQLFRTGGSGTVRGYSYLSLGRRQGGVTTGAGALFIGSAEVVRWLTPSWGAATFVDLGATGDDFTGLAWARGIGVGARWKTVAGPLALDLAYGSRTRDGVGGRVRIHFAVAIAF